MSSPETTTSQESPVIPAEKLGLLQPDMVEQLRAQQLHKLHLARVAAYNTGESMDDAVEATVATFGATTEEFLAQHGITEDDPNFSSLHTTLRNFSVDSIPEDEWYAGRYTVKEDDKFTDRNAIIDTELTPSGRDQLRETLNVLNPDADISQGETKVSEPGSQLEAQLQALQEKDPEYKNALEALTRCREKLAEITAKELGKPMSMRTKKYNAAREAYNAQLIKVGKIVENHLQSTLPERTENEQHTTTIAYLLQEQTELRNQTRANFTDTKVSKFVDRFGQWLSRGTKIERVGKGLTVGVAAGSVALVGGAIGGAAALIGTSGVLLTRFIKNYAQHDNERGLKVTEETTNSLDIRQVLETADASHADAVTHLDKLFDQDKNEQQSKRRKAMAWGIGGIAVGTAIGTMAHSLFSGSEKSYQSTKGDSVVQSTTVLPEYGDEHRMLISESLGDRVNPGLITGSDGGVETTPSVDANGLEGIGNATGQFFSGEYGTTKFNAEGVKDFNQWADGYRVKSGDSVWHLAEHYLQDNGVKHPSHYQVDAIKDQMLKDWQGRDIIGKQGWLQKGVTIKIK